MRGVQTRCKLYTNVVTDSNKSTVKTYVLVPLLHCNIKAVEALCTGAIIFRKSLILYKHFSSSKVAFPTSQPEWGLLYDPQRRCVHNVGDIYVMYICTLMQQCYYKKSRDNLCTFVTTSTHPFGQFLLNFPGS